MKVFQHRKNNKIRKWCFTMSLDLTLQQRQQLSQSQIQSLEILAMDSIELNQLLKNEYLENPMMEHNGDTSENSYSEPLTSYYEPSGGAYTSTDDED